MKKLLSVLLCAVCALTLCFSAVACDDSGDDSGNTSPGGYQTYVMEAEYIDLDGIRGSGVSNEMIGVNMIFGNGTAEEKANGWSNGYFVCGTDADKLQLKFVFDSEAATTGVSFTLRFGNERETFTFTPDTLSIQLNGEEIDYSPITVQGPCTLEEMTFKDYVIGNNLSLKKGENVITLTVHAESGAAYATGPRVDCIKLKSKSKLTFHAKTGNIEERDNQEI